MLAQEFRNQIYKDTVEQIQEYEDKEPAILQWLYKELQESLEDENET